MKSQAPMLSKKKPDIAVLQMTSSADLEKNLTFVEEKFKELKEHNVNLVVLPENFAFMGLSEANKLRVAEVYKEGPIQRFVKNLAQKFKVWIVAGSMPIRGKYPEQCYASSIVFDDVGNYVARYDKMHLFDVTISKTESHKESNSTLAGDKIQTFQTPFGCFGLSICYDLRFPEFYRSLKESGADCFIVPAAFTYDTGKAHWETLLKARAIENLSFVIAANQCGTHENGRRTFGHSMIVSYWGEVLASCNETDTGFAIAKLNFENMNDVRKRFPCLAHQRIKV